MTVIKRFDFLHRQILRHGLGNVTKPNARKRIKSEHDDPMTKR
jgi:hypothetical protein